MDVLQRLSNNNIIPTCAPFIQHNIGEENCLMVDLPVDVLCFVPLDLPTKDINQLICDTISRQIEAMGCNIRDNIDNGKVFLPEAFHFQPPESDYFLSIIYPKDIADDNLESSRKKLHEVFCLPSNRPLLKRNNKYIFGGEEIPGGYLLNPHTQINIQPLKDSKFYLVKGNYTYHHYMQDNFDDNKWGCAYRSLQTLCSWFRFQGYTERPVPTHKEIQQALVDIGDKDPKFIGSRKWIGSLEVSYCLDNLIGVTSKILSVSAGADLANKGRELAQHFSTQGTPVMIGGGVLAHTILGINFSEVTGDIRFLILDPHYTGGEYIREVLDKGWCGWKGPDFWDQTAMYNMCLPQIPSNAL
ncbi:hypothetical protein LOTGIDRAFT_190780 [Lottia gigantea]|uniref:Ufm1-specific protease 2 n=1 Tax=Lottia gigantea TaxID=225164 RepID=V4A6P5_LOTGI|nr:hypothetical protein LOTGIDRAFT_190780 [Lottia gigantea]ESO92372.1 hypothetical protein LOTGIDRAFT_190780 [Lottia gigantea]